jgi:hypothetical protein
MSQSSKKKKKTSLIPEKKKPLESSKSCIFNSALGHALFQNKMLLSTLEIKWRILQY